MFLSPPQSLFCSCNLPHFISRQTPLKTSDWLLSRYLCDDQMSRLGGEAADIYEDQGSEKRKKKQKHNGLTQLSVFLFFLFLLGGLGSCDIKPCQRSNLEEDPYVALTQLLKGRILWMMYDLSIYNMWC